MKSGYTKACAVCGDMQWVRLVLIMNGEMVFSMLAQILSKTRLFDLAHSSSYVFKRQVQQGDCKMQVAWFGGLSCMSSKGMVRWSSHARVSQYHTCSLYHDRSTQSCPHLSSWLIFHPHEGNGPHHHYPEPWCWGVLYLSRLSWSYGCSHGCMIQQMSPPPLFVITWCCPDACCPLTPSHHASVSLSLCILLSYPSGSLVSCSIKLASALASPPMLFSVVIAIFVHQ